MSRDESRRSKRCRADRDFEMGPETGILGHDYDDERTLDEEEALEGGEDTHNELSHLQKESDMPLKDLLDMYGYGDMSCQDPSKAEDEDEDEEDEEEEEDDEEDEDDDDPPSYELKQFYTEMVKGEENGANIKRASTAKDSDSVRSGESAAHVPGVNAHTNASNIEQKVDGGNGAGATDVVSGDPQNASGTADIGSGSENVNSTSAAISGSNVGGSSTGSGSGGGGSSRLLRSVSRPQSEEEEDDCDYSPDEEEWKKTIMVGSDYQAAIPEGLCRYDDALPYENEDKMLWDPSHISEEQVEEFLERAQLPAVKGTSLPSGSHVRDDEQALYLLLQCGYNLEEALRRRRMNVLPPTGSVSLWSEEECHNFESGLRNFGKDFYLIQKNKVRTRSVGELVQFYYLWKKTERHDIFTYKARLEKKKYALHPGITDYMDRFLEEQEGVRDRSSSPNVHCLLYGDAKRQRTNTNSMTNDEPSSGGGKSGIDSWDMGANSSAGGTGGKSALDNWDVGTNSNASATTTTTTTSTTNTTSSGGTGGTESTTLTSVNSGPADPLALDHHHNTSSSSSVTAAVTASQFDCTKPNSAAVETSAPGVAAAPWPSSSNTSTNTTTTPITSSSSSSSSTVAPTLQQQQLQQQRNHLHHMQQQQQQQAASHQYPTTVNNNENDLARSPENILPHLPP